MQYTSNYNLIKPDGTDIVNIADLNENADIIDLQLKNLNDNKLANTGTAASANKLATARTIALSGDATGSVTFDGSVNATITVTVTDDSHNHTIANVDGLQAALDDVLKHNNYGTATGTNTLVMTLSPAPTSLVAGLTIRFKNTTANTGAVTLNVNSLGAKSVLKSGGVALAAGNLKAGGVYTVCYDGTNFILQGEGGSGTALASDLLSGKTASSDAGDIVGTIPSKAAATITPGTTNQTISAGQYLSGAQTIAGDADLIPANILVGVTIFGVAGNAEKKVCTTGQTPITIGENIFVPLTFTPTTVVGVNDNGTLKAYSADIGYISGGGITVGVNGFTLDGFTSSVKWIAWKN